MSLRFHLYAEPDCSCYLKLEGENQARRFTDFLEALNYAHSTVGEDEADVVVYDSTGRVAMRSRIGQSKANRERG